NPNLKIEGLLRTMYDPRNSLTREVSEQLSEHFGDRLYQTVIPRNVRLAEAPSYGLPVLAYDKQSRGAVAYLALAGELVRRTRKAASEAAGWTIHSFGKGQHRHGGQETRLGTGAGCTLGADRRQRDFQRRRSGSTTA